MDIKLVKRGKDAELILTGRLNTSNAEQVTDIFLKTAAKYNDVTLNLAALDFISSAGLRAFKTLYIRLKKKGGTLYLMNISPYVREVLEITGSMEMFIEK